jgi:hypothetical protein
VGSVGVWWLAFAGTQLGLVAGLPSNFPVDVHADEQSLLRLLCAGRLCLNFLHKTREAVEFGRRAVHHSLVISSFIETPDSDQEGIYVCMYIFMYVCMYV